MKQYTFNVFWSEPDESYIATIDELPGLSAFGDTEGEAIKEAGIATEGYLEIQEEDGE